MNLATLRTHGSDEHNLDDRAQAMRRFGFLDAAIAALARREAVCQLIAEASDEAEAGVNLSRLLEITEEQAGAVLEIRLGQFTAARRSTIASERRELSAALDQFEATTDE